MNRKGCWIPGLLCLTGALTVGWASARAPASEAPAVVPAEDPSAADTPDAVTVISLVRDLNQRNSTLREAAIRRLLPYPDLASRLVVDQFALGNLQTRLAALELLQAWKAPVTRMDPWRPETLAETRLQALRHWTPATKIKSARPSALTPAMLKEAREEIGRMLKASGKEAIAIRERLARHGRLLLPEIHQQLQEATTDLDRERLAALRYRLVAADALVLSWPLGLERLASTTALVRQQAVQELASRATSAEEPLLLELFNHPDPLVREISLRALKEIAGSEATAVLTRLLRDPEPNVRAAVLKLFAEQPSPGMVARIVEYVRGEKDPDLVVHAVRALSGSESAKATECLTNLLGHSRWQVRAEAAEALGKRVEQHSSNPEKNADVCAAMIHLLEDPDGFVVGRAVTVLAKVDLAIAVEPLAKAASRHPELATAVVKAFSGGSNMGAKAIAYLQKFCGHANPEVRAAAIEGLVGVDPENADKELRIALQDQDSVVRQAAAVSFCNSYYFPKIQEFLKIKPKVVEDSRFGRKRVKEVESEEIWKQLVASKTRPAWLGDYVKLLRPFLAAKDTEERLDGALALILMFQEDQAVPVLLAAAQKQPNLQGKAAQALAWLPWPKRQNVFHKLLGFQPPPDEFAKVVSQMGQLRDKSAIPLFWDLTRRQGLDSEGANAVLQGLLFQYFGSQLQQRNNNTLGVSAADQELAATAARGRATKGPDMQRLIALAVLLPAAPAEVPEMARQIIADSRAGPALRRDAYQIMLLSQGPAERAASTVTGLAHPDPNIRKLAVAILARGIESFTSLRQEKVSLTIYDNSHFDSSSNSRGQVIVPEAPKRIRPAQVRPLLRDPDPETAAHAGYLLVLLDEPDGLAPLLQHWRTHRTDPTWRRLVFRALAVRGDDSQVPMLEEIYRAITREDSRDIREFYWTIRIMEGPNALRLRKQIRKEIGMENLR